MGKMPEAQNFLIPPRTLIDSITLPQSGPIAACHTLSNAFLKSKTICYRFLLYRYFSLRILMLKICSLVLLLALNPGTDIHKDGIVLFISYIRIVH